MVAKTVLLHPGNPPLGNQCHRAPELLDTVRRLSVRGAVPESVSVAGQAVFEMGVLIFELLFKRHPILGKHSAFTSTAGVACVFPLCHRVQFCQGM